MQALNASYIVIFIFLCYYEIGVFKIIDKKYQF